MPTASPLTIIAIITAAAGQEKKLRALQEILVAETVKEAGCLRYELNQSLDDGKVLLFVESWADEPAWEAHMQGAAIKRFQAAAANMIQDFTVHRMAMIADGKSKKISQ